MASNVVKECGVCTEEFNEDQRCPRILPCFHTLCSFCILDLIIRNNRTCPFCRHEFQGDTANVFRVNNNALELLKYVQDLELQVSSQEDRSQDLRSKRIDEMKKDTLKVNNFSLISCTEAQKQLKTTFQFNNDLKQEIQKATNTIEENILVTVQNVADRNKRQMAYLEQENQRLEEQIKKMKKRHKQIKGAQRKVESGDNMKEIALAIAESEDITNYFQKKLKTFQSRQRKEEKLRLRIEKVFKTTKEKITVMERALKELTEEDTDDDTDDDDEDDDVTDKSSCVEMTPKRDNTPIVITAESLRNLNASVRRLIDDGVVYVVQQFQGKSRYAQIAIYENKYLCVHHLKDQPVIANDHLLQFEEVMRQASSPSKLIFLELESLSSGTNLGKIFIQLTSNTLRGRNFFLMCTGTAGPSYSGTRMLSVSDQGCPEEFVWTGDYEQNDGFGGRALVTGAGSEVGDALKKPWLAGTVTGGSLVDAFASHFLIYTRNCPGKVLDRCFGQVVEGLEILTRAITQHPNVRDVAIRECGIVLSTV